LKDSAGLMKRETRSEGSNIKKTKNMASSWTVQSGMMALGGCVAGDDGGGGRGQPGTLVAPRL
jgi:hypothetical protein